MKSIIKLMVIYVLRIIMYILRVFPVNKKRIIFSSYRGYQYACNPKYISEYLLREHLGEYEIIWAFQKPCKYEFLRNQGVRLVGYNSLKRFYYEATAKFSVNNIGSFSYLPRRRGQEHINTWHSGFDITGCALTEPRNDKIMCKTLLMSSAETTLFLASNKWFSDFALQAQFGYHGEVLKYGLPRSDDLVNGKKEQLEKRMRKYLGVSEDTIIFMYGPTWRYGGIKDNPHIDFRQISQVLEKKYEDNYLIIKRSHHLAKEKVTEDKHIRDLTDYPNVEEIMSAVNIFVSDYSSLIWDASLVHAYVILFAPDVDQYAIERTMYKPIEEWGYPVAFTQKELNERLMEADLPKGITNANNFLEMYGSYETGKAAEQFYNWMRSRK